MSDVDALLGIREIERSSCRHCGVTAELVHPLEIAGHTPLWQHYTEGRGRYAPCNEWLWTHTGRTLDRYLAAGGTFVEPLADNQTS